MRDIAHALRSDYEASARSTNVFRIMAVYRIGRAIWLSDLPLKRLLMFLASRAQKWLVIYPYHVEISFGTQIGPGVSLYHPRSIVVHGTAVIGERCTIYHGVTVGTSLTSKNPGQAAVIGDDVLLGTGAKVIGALSIGDGAKIGANAVVTKDVPAGGRALSLTEIQSQRANTP